MSTATTSSVPTPPAAAPIPVRGGVLDPEARAAAQAARIASSKRTAERATHLLNAGKISINEALGFLSQAGAAPRAVSSTAQDDATVAARAAVTALTDTILAHEHLIRPAAAARQLLIETGGGVPPQQPPPQTTSFEEYAKHAWLDAHSELDSPNRRVHLAVNKWVRANASGDRARDALRSVVRGQAANLKAVWATEHATAMANLPRPENAHLSELWFNAPGVRVLGSFWGYSHPRAILLSRFLTTTFETQSSTSHYVIAQRGGGRFMVPVPTSWAHWLSGPVKAFHVSVGEPVETPALDQHELALRLWDRGRGPDYRDAYDAAAAILQPAQGDHPV